MPLVITINDEVVAHPLRFEGRFGFNQIARFRDEATNNHAE